MSSRAGVDEPGTKAMDFLDLLKMTILESVEEMCFDASHSGSRPTSSSSMGVPAPTSSSSNLVVSPGALTPVSASIRMRSLKTVIGLIYVEIGSMRAAPEQMCFACPYIHHFRWWYADLDWIFTVFHQYQCRVPEQAELFSNTLSGKGGGWTKCSDTDGGQCSIELSTALSPPVCFEQGTERGQLACNRHQVGAGQESCSSN